MLSRSHHDVQLSLPRLPAGHWRRIRRWSAPPTVSIPPDEGTTAVPFHTEHGRWQTQARLFVLNAAPGSLAESPIYGALDSQGSPPEAWMIQTGFVRRWTCSFQMLGRGTNWIRKFRNLNFIRLGQRTGERRVIRRPRWIEFPPLGPNPGVRLKFRLIWFPCLSHVARHCSLPGTTICSRRQIRTEQRCLIL